VNRHSSSKINAKNSGVRISKTYVQKKILSVSMEKYQNQGFIPQKEVTVHKYIHPYFFQLTTLGLNVSFLVV